MTAAARRELRVELADTDATGGIHHTAAFRWVEQTEQQLLRQLGVADTIAYPRRRIVIEFDHALRYGDQLEVHLALERVGRTSVDYRWFAQRGDTVVFHGMTTVVHVSDGAPAPVPQEIRTALKGTTRDTA